MGGVSDGGIGVVGGEGGGRGGGANGGDDEGGDEGRGGEGMIMGGWWEGWRNNCV